MEPGSDVTGPITPGQQAAVETLLRQRDLPARQRERLEMVKAAWLGPMWTPLRGGRGAPPAHGAPPKADAAYLGALEMALDTHLAGSTCRAMSGLPRG